MDTMQETRFKIYKILADRFNNEELRTLCFALGIDYDDLPGNGKSGKARELITHLEHRDEIPRLIEIGKQLRPEISWPNVLEIIGTSRGASLKDSGTLQIMVTGGRDISHQLRRLAHLVGQQVILRGHVLLSNGSKGIDEASSEGALAACRSTNLNPNLKIQIFRPRSAPTPNFDFGNLQIAGANYDERRNFVVQRSDAIILLGGGRGTNYVARQARIMEKPIIPIGIGERDVTAVKLWYQIKSGGKDELPLILINDKSLNMIGPSQQDIDKVSLSSVIIAEDLSENSRR